MYLLYLSCVDINLDISGLKIPEETKQGIAEALSENLSFGLRSKRGALMVFIPDRLKSAIYFWGKVTIVKSANKVEFARAIQMALLSHREYVPATILIEAINKKSIHEKERPPEDHRPGETRSLY